MKRKLPYCILISLILITPFFYSDNLYNGLISAKQIWFYGAMALLILTFGIDLLFRRRNVSFILNIVDISLLTFYTYFFIRAAFTPYTPLIYNTRFINLSFLVILYFIIKGIIISLKSHSIVTQLPFNSHSIVNLITYKDPMTMNDVRSTNDNRMTHELQMSAQPNDVKRMTPAGQITSNSRFIFIIIHFLIITGLIQAVWGLLQLYGVTRSFHSGFKITGTFFNPAPYALYLAAIFPLALGYLLQTKNDVRSANNNRMTAAGQMTVKPNDANRMTPEANDNQNSLIPSFLNYFNPSFLISKLAYYISLLAVISIILVLPAIMNRASWLGIAASSLFVFNYKYNLINMAKSYLHNTARKLCALAIVILLIGFMGAGLYLLKKGSSDGKLLIWEVTIGKISEKPLFGHGVGRFEAEYNNWQAGYFQNHPEEMDGPKGMAAGNTKYCFNEYLEMASEIGLVGLLLFLVVIASVFLGIRKGIVTTIDVRSTNDARSANDNRMTPKANDTKQMTLNENSLIPSLLISSFISLLVCALISFPFYSLPTLIIFFLLLAIISSRLKGIPISARLMGSFIIRSFDRVSTLSTHSTFSTLSTFTTLLSISVLLLLLTRQQYEAYYTWYEAEMLYQTGSYNEACKTFPEVCVPLQYTGSYLQYYGKALYLNEEYAKSITMLERAGKFCTDEILYCSLGDSYRACKMYIEAKEAYRYASFMVPHKLYPLYLLATLHDEMWQKEEAVEVANKILKKEIKVESEATEEIRMKMRKIIEKNK